MMVRFGIDNKVMSHAFKIISKKTQSNDKELLVAINGAENWNTNRCQSEKEKYKKRIKEQKFYSKEDMQKDSYLELDSQQRGCLMLDALDLDNSSVSYNRHLSCRRNAKAEEALGEEIKVLKCILIHNEISEWC